MALHKFNVGTNPDGSQRFQYVQDDRRVPVVVTGPITGTVTLPDGSVYDVTADVIEVWPGHELLVSDAIGARHEAEGHPGHDADKPFVATPSSVSHDNRELFVAEVVAGVAPDVDSSPQGVAARVNKKAQA